MPYKPINFENIKSISTSINVEPCALWAICSTESKGLGFIKAGEPTILFEGHVFWKELKKNNINPEDLADKYPDILYPKWTKAHYKGGAKEYERLNKALQINESAALASASWGAFQIMGFNYASCGFKSVQEFVAAHKKDSASQLNAFISFLQNNKLIDFLKSKDWEGFARRYNGPGYKANRYDYYLANAYEKCLKTL